MRKSIKGCIAVILFLCAIILIIIGLVLTTKQTLYNNLLENIRSEKKLRDDSIGYKIWSSPKELTFAINLFHVENPNEILLGELPRLIERGPYFYDIKLEREILSVNEIRDEITFNFKKTYYFNDEKSGELSEHDEVLVINMAYLGAINTVT
ncbi:hypothetical protein M0802_012169 [Mischocyttarus mexicanus]|nr:hypothetical protein M0802_012169 [Mischocyttarus mexicanus]